MNFGVQFFCNSMCKTGFEISFVFTLLPIWVFVFYGPLEQDIYIFFEFLQNLLNSTVKLTQLFT